MYYSLPFIFAITQLPQVSVRVTSASESLVQRVLFGLVNSHVVRHSLHAYTELSLQIRLRLLFHLISSQIDHHDGTKLQVSCWEFGCYKLV